MGTCADALRELRGIADRLNALDSFGTGNGLHNEQANVVRLVQNSPCPALTALAHHVQHDRPDQVLIAWRNLVVNGLEPTEPTLPRVSAIRAQFPEGMAQAVSTNEPPRSAPLSVPMNVWIDHARSVVAVLIARVERTAKTEAVDQPAVSAAMGAELDRLRDTLFDAGRKAYTLAESVERLEAVYAKETQRIESGWFYVGSTEHTGRALLDPIDDDQFPPNERPPRRTAIENTLALRAAVDEAVEATKAAAPHMDSPYESVDRRWTHRTISQLRLLRGAILKGHSRDIYPSALPMIRAGVPEALRTHADEIAKRMEEVKSAILAGVQPQPKESPKPSRVNNGQEVAAAFAHLSDLQSLFSRYSSGSNEAMTHTVIVAREGIRCAGVLLAGFDPSLQHLVGVALDRINDAKNAWANAEKIIGKRMPDAERFAFDARLLLTQVWNDTYDAFLNPELRRDDKLQRWIEHDVKLGLLLDRLGCMAPSEETRAADAPPQSGGGKKKRKRAKPAKVERPLTPNERKTLEVVGRHTGNIASAARELGRDPKTVRENYFRAQEKMNKTIAAISRSKSGDVPLPTDRRGQSTI